METTALTTGITSNNLLPYSTMSLLVLKKEIKLNKKYSTLSWYEAVVRFLIGGKKALQDKALQMRRLIIS